MTCQNTVIPGDCLDILPTLPGDYVDLIVTSPPYNVGLDYGPLVNDARPWEEYYDWLESVLAALYRVLKTGGVLALNLPKEVKLPKDQMAVYGQRVQKVATIADEICHRLGYLPRESIVWAKGGEGLPIASTSKTGSDNNIYLRAVSEMILLYSKERYYVDGGTGRRGMEDVPWQEETKDLWWIPAARRSKGHPCPFPADVPRRLIDLFTRLRPDKGFVPLVLDPFAGSGIVGVVARQMGRNFLGIEVNPEFAALANEQIAGTTPIFSDKIVAKTIVQAGKTVTTLTIPLAAILIDYALEIRDGLDEATVEQYMAVFDRLPPAKVFRQTDGTYLLSAGFHRLEAARRLGRTEVTVEVKEGDRQAAWECGLRDNLAHGKTLTRAEWRKVVGAFLKMSPERSDSWLAGDLGVSDHTVRSVREELEATSQIAKLERLVGADGKERPRRMPETAATDEIADNPALTETAAQDVENSAPNTTAGVNNPPEDMAVDLPDEDEILTETAADRPLLQMPDIPAPQAVVDLSQILLAQANAIHIPLPDESVHSTIFSPPYWALRRYEGASQVFAWPGMQYAMPGGVVTLPGDPACAHDWQERVQPSRQGTIGDKSTLGGNAAWQEAARYYPTVGRDNRNGQGASSLGQGDRYADNLRDFGELSRADEARSGQPLVTHFCAKCRAVRCALGLEPDPDMFVGHMVLLLREVGRVLRKDGTLWLNLGFSYAASRGYQIDGSKQTPGSQPPGLPAHLIGPYKPKDIVPVPWLVAIAAQYDGWYLRSPIVWSKRNGMPSSSQDRPTLDFEHILLLSRSDRYYFDAHAIREPLDPASVERNRYAWNSQQRTRDPRETRGEDKRAPGDLFNPAGRNKRATWDSVTETARLAENLVEAGYDLETALSQAMGITAKNCSNPVISRALELHQGGRDLAEALRLAFSLDPNDPVTETASVWRVNTSPYKGSHYATYPLALVARMIQAGAAPAVCARCGTPYERVVERSLATDLGQAGDDPTLDTGRAGFNRPRQGEPQTRVLTVPQAEIAAYLATAANGRAAECRARYGTKWEHWTRTDDSGARLPIPSDWADLKEFLGLDDRYDRDMMPHVGKQLEYMRFSDEFNLSRRGRTSTEIKDEWLHHPGYTDFGWRPDCACFDHALTPPDDVVDHTVLHPVCAACGQPHTQPATVLDVTAGSGTTVQAARLLGRRGIGLDISGTYLRDQAIERVAKPARIYRKPDLPALAWQQPLPENEAIYGDIANVLPRLPRAAVDLLFLDPPFNIGKVYGSGVDDKLPEAHYWELLRFWVDLSIPLLKSTGSVVIYHIPQWAFRLAAHLESRGLYFRGWVARRADQHNYANRPLFAPEHYPFLWFSRSKEYTFNQVRVPHKRCARCGDYATHWGGKEQFRDEAGKFAPDVWDDLPNPRNYAKARLANELPVEAVLRWVLALTNPGDYVLDPMLGSGTTAAAGELAGRKWGGVEIDRTNVAAIRRKTLVGRGAGRAITPAALVELPAETRLALAAELQRLWGAEETAEDENMLLTAGQQAAQEFLDSVSERAIANDVQ